MYIQSHFEQGDVGAMHALIAARPLGAWVVHAGGELIVNHMPFLLESARGEVGTLCAHIPRANEVWRVLSSAAESVVIFQGADAYITPSWYPSKRSHGKAVPTWNYTVVHAHGIARVIDDPDWLLAHVAKLSQVHERNEANPWQVSDAPADYIDKMLAAIVGVEIPILRLEGKWKASQNRPPADREAIVAGLLARGDEQSVSMATLVRGASEIEGDER